MRDKAAVLIVDDEETLCRYLGKELKREGYCVHDALEGDTALRLLVEKHIDVILLDIYMPGMDGMSTLKTIQEVHPLTQVIILTGNATVETALDSMKAGAYDYLMKPYNFTELCLLIDRAFSELCTRKENEVLRYTLSQEGRDYKFIGSSVSAVRILKAAEMAANCDLPVLICGETGTGKEIVARTIHRMSANHEGPFLVLNCSAVQEGILESELFGHERGAFTDAHSRRVGLVELAEGGTLFLDEVGELSPSAQVKLLRFLDSGEFRRMGGTRLLRVKLRLLSATNLDLERAIVEGRFRKDLYYRLNGMSIRTSALRESREDIPQLAEYFLERLCVRQGLGRKLLSRKALETLALYHWPGNVRELQNIVERVLILSGATEIESEDIDRAFKLGLGDPGLTPTNATLSEMERVHILRVLSEVGGDRSLTSKILDINLKTLNSKLRAYGRIPNLQE